MSALLRRKVKLFSAGPLGRCQVWQDGSESDADATSGYRFDDAFYGGAPRPSTTDAENVEALRLGQLKHSYDNGKTFSFSVVGARAWRDNSAGCLRINPNDRVEFWAEVPDALPATLASWHLNQATPGDRVRLFKGHVVNVRAAGEGSLDVECRDVLYKADDVMVVRQPGSVDIPKLGINLPQDSPDWYWAPKVDTTDPAGWVYGETGDRQYRLTLKQILEYLATEYGATLEAEGVLDTGADLFDASDLSTLTYRPDAIILERMGFAAAVREILKWAPDRRLVVDHQTSTWRIVPWGVALGAASGLLYQQFTSGPVTVLRLPMATSSYYSATPGANGNRIRIYDGDNPSHNEEAVVASKNTSGPVGGEVQLTLDRTLSRFYSSFMTGSVNFSRVAPVLSETLPTVAQSIDESPAGSLDLEKDLADAYSAVEIYSAHQKTETVSRMWYEDISGPRLKPAWDRAFETDWRERDGERESDKGTDGRGFVVYAITNNGTHDQLKLRFSDSQHGPHHTANEWQGTTLHVLTSGGSDVADNDHVFTVLANAAVADVGDGSAGLLVTLDTAVGGFLADVGTFDLASAGTPDRAELTHDYRFATTIADNARWGVGRKWYIDETDHIQGATSGLHSQTCRPVKVEVDNGLGVAPRVTALESARGYPSTNWNPSGAFEYAGGGGPGTFLIFRRKSFYTDRPTGTCPGGQGWTPPASVTATIERTSTTVRVARYPAGSDHGGQAREAYNLTRTLYVETDLWTEDQQDADFQTLAEKLWNAYQQAHGRGSLRLPGTREFAAYLDLACRVSFTTATGTAEDRSAVFGFWGSLTGCTLDFENDAVALEFDNKAQLNIDLSIVAALALKPRAASNLANIRATAAKQLAECLASLARDSNPSYVCGSRTYEPSNGRPIPPVLRLPGKDNQTNDIVPTGEGVTEVGPSGYGATSLATHGPAATQTVVMDHAGDRFRIGSVGEIVPGTVSGGLFADAATPATSPRSVPTDALQGAAAALAAFGGMVLPLPARAPIYARTDAGSTVDVVKISAPVLPTVADATGWRVVVLDFKDRKARQVYDLASISGGTDLNLAASIADAAGAPGSDRLAIVLPPLVPHPDPADFADGSVGFQDTGGDWWVVEPDGGTGTVYKATLSGALLSLDAGGGTLAMAYGPTAGTGVSVTLPTGLGGGGGGIDVDFGLVTEAASSSLDWGAV